MATLRRGANSIGLVAGRKNPRSQGSVNGLNSSLTLDDTSLWNMTDPSIIGNLTNDGGITPSNASGSTGTLPTVDNTPDLQDDSQITRR